MEASVGRIVETPHQEIDRIYLLQQKNKIDLANMSYRYRISQLKKLKNAILKYRSDITAAVYADCKRHASEVDMTETYPVIAEIKLAMRELHRWMKAKPVSTPFALLGSSSKMMYEPKGNVLIIAPWNFPVNLCFSPLVSAISAGNAVMLKPSEFSPQAAAVMRKIVNETFDEREVALVEGGIETSKYLLEKKYDHIFFTGSPQVGKIVMTAAAKHLCSVTLELGGKSPAIVDVSADINTAAKRIAWGKFVNNGQICIAPDYVLVHENQAELFFDLIKKHIQDFYGEAKSNDSYSRIIDDRHFDRLIQLLENAVANGAELVCGGRHDRSDEFIEPTVLKNVSLSSDIMLEEIFGPLLPVLVYNNLVEVLKLINEKEKPLALYIFSRDKKVDNYILKNTRAGGSCINHTGVHYYNGHLPFGGVNNSGIGKAHGESGFREFSNERGVFKQHVPNALELLVPPYNSFKQKLIDLTIKYF